MSSNQDYPPIIFVLGPPGAGKGYLCERAAKEMPRIKHVVMSDLLREEAQKPGSVNAPEIDRKLPTGTLVSGDLATAVLKKFLSGLSPDTSQTILLDGFPRNLGQAQKFEEKIGTAKATISLMCSRDILEKRLAHRGRDDDDPTIAANRHQGHLDETLPAIDHLRSSDCTVTEVIRFKFCSPNSRHD
ncbi:MAG: hypothetical protein Q9225_006822 [Loekoesia sp. 1 TL-2023]